MKEPKIRFKGFKGEWENTPFSETFDSLKNNSLSRAELSDSGEVMNIHYGDVLIKYGECVDVIKEVETFVKDEEVAKKLHQSCAIKNGDVIFADAAEDNTVIRQWRMLGQRISTAADSQALLHLYQNYCQHHECVNCDVGYRIFFEQRLPQ